METNENIPTKFVSDNILEDRKMMLYCNQNPLDDKCKCISPGLAVKSIQLNNYTSHYCFYRPCLLENKGYYITSLIKYEQTYCKLNYCEIDVGDITVDGNGKITIKNECIYNFNKTNTVISEVLLQESLNNEHLINYSFPYSNFPIFLLCLTFLFIF